MIKSIVLYIALFSIINIVSIAQDRRNYNWLTGSSYILDFNNLVSNRPTLRSLWNMPVNQDAKIYSYGTTIYSDSATGAMRFLSAGRYITDSALNYIQNGHAMNYPGWGTSDGSHQECILLQVGKTIYLFHVGITDTAYTGQVFHPYYNKCQDKLLMSIIDPQANNGLGVVTTKAKVMLTAFMLGAGMQVMRHANGKDWWLLKQIWEENAAFTFLDSNRLARWLVKEDTVIGPEIIKMQPRYKASDSTKVNFNSYVAAGITFNETGDKILISRERNFYLGRFNRCTGNIENPKIIYNPAPPLYRYLANKSDSILNQAPLTGADSFNHGMCFSKNDRFIYISQYFRILQWEYNNPDSATAWVTLQNGYDTIPNKWTPYGGMKLGPDNRIYIGNYGGGEGFHVIDSPDVKGIGCKLVFRRISNKSIPNLNNPGSLQYPPTLPNYNIGLDSTSCWPLYTEPIHIKTTDWLLYPNPVSTEVVLQFGKALLEPTDLIITNMAGQIVVQSTIPSGAIYKTQSLSLPNGVYVVSCNGRSKRLVVR
jgi:hypothetical protein